MRAKAGGVIALPAKKPGRAGSQAQSRRAQSPHPPTDPRRAASSTKSACSRSTPTSSTAPSCRCATAPPTRSRSGNGQRSAATPLPARARLAEEDKEAIGLAFSAALGRDATTALRGSGFRFNKSFCSTGKGSPILTRPKRLPRHTAGRCAGKCPCHIQETRRHARALTWLACAVKAGLAEQDTGRHPRASSPSPPRRRPHPPPIPPAGYQAFSEAKAEV